MAEQLYGFNRQDANQLIRLIGTGGNGEAVDNGSSGGLFNGLYRFELSSSLLGGSATGTIKYMDGTTAAINQTISDPEGIFSSLGSGDTGLCLAQDSVYYVIQAPC